MKTNAMQFKMEYNYTPSSTILNWTEQSVVSCIAWCCAHGLCPLERLLGNRKRYGAKGHGRIWCLVVKDHMKSFCQIRILMILMVHFTPEDLTT